MKCRDLNLIFMGTPEIAATVFEAMINDGFHFVALIAQPDKPQGRSGKIVPVPTKVVAEKYNIPVFQPLKIRKEYEFVRDLKPDLIITIAYGQIIPQELLDIPTYGCYNLHGSLLPKYRGASPIQQCLINGDKLTGMSLMEMTKGMDEGDVFSVETIEIDENDNNSSLFIKMADAASRLIIRDADALVNNELTRTKQDENLVTYCHTIKPEQERIDFNLTATNILGWIKALSDVPGAYLYIDETKYKIFKAKLYSNDVTGQIGEIVKADKNGLVIQCLEGQLAILEIQKEGKKRMDYKSFLNGNQGLLNKIAK